MSGSARDRLTVAAYSAGWSGVRHLPEAAAYAAFDRIADLAWHRRGASVRQLEANLRRASPDAGESELRETSRAGLRSYLRYWCDAFRLPDWDRDRVVSRLTCHHEERMREGLARGGVVAALPHMGNWDHAGAWASLTGASVTTVAERLRPEALHRRFLAYRASLGMEILPLDGAGHEILGQLKRRLREGHLVPLLADRDLRRTGIEVTLLGERTRMAPGPALLALQTGAALHPVTLRYAGTAPRHRTEITFAPQVHPPAGGTTRQKVQAMTQEVADAFGAAIAESPQDWHMLQPLWLSDLGVAAVRTPAARA